MTISKMLQVRQSECASNRSEALWARHAILVKKDCVTSHLRDVCDGGYRGDDEVFLPVMEC